MSESHLSVVKEPKAPKLVYDEPVEITSLGSVAVSSIALGDFGSPPEDGFSRSVATFGVTVPVLLRPQDGGYRVVDGRRRLLAALLAGHTHVPASVVSSGDPDLLDPALTMAGNAHTSPNPVIELDAIEALIAKVGAIGPTDIAKATGVPLKILRRRMGLSRLRHELRDAWRAGRFGTKVGEAAASLQDHLQAELVARLEANGTLTIEDVRDVKRSSVKRHQRTLPDDRWRERAVEALERARKDVFLAAGEDHPAVQLIREAIMALEEES